MIYQKNNLFMEMKVNAKELNIAFSLDFRIPQIAK
jgi:hypothetical protein